MLVIIIKNGFKSEMKSVSSSTSGHTPKIIKTGNCLLENMQLRLEKCLTCYANKKVALICLLFDCCGHLINQVCPLFNLSLNFIYKIVALTMHLLYRQLDYYTLIFK